MQKLVWLALAVSLGLAPLTQAAEAQMSAASGEYSRGPEDPGDRDRDRDGEHDRVADLVQRDGTGTAGPQIPNNELELICGGPGTWMSSWIEDDNGDPVPGTFDYECLSDDE